ncbi:hypothetical protein F2Q70_00028147 [Brassica cretica]|uniref:Uncharacterized protein n=1 Tax=Brassica cretica TaxID=69181 RepID=A0A8S9LE43_BRACR|nr:hypothetical protein F2Q68_00027718 [Brassica cretica]KAF2605195.1 hypothetical protein F2Q70_00028147 [Brassica cretica]
MDSSCWTDVSLNKNRGWRWREGRILLAGLMSLSSRIKGWIEVDLRMNNLIFLEPGRFEGITKLPGNLLDGLECAEVVPNLKEKELLELDGK